jgi:hypothetical protein
VTELELRKFSAEGKRYVSGTNGDQAAISLAKNISPIQFQFTISNSQLAIRNSYRHRRQICIHPPQAYPTPVTNHTPQSGRQ